MARRQFIGRDRRPHRPFRLRPEDTESPFREDKDVFSPKLNREWSRRAIGRKRAQYVVTRNPIFAWFAYFEARSGKQPIPAWVHDYFDQVCRNLSFLVKAPPKKRQIDAAIAAAVGFIPGGVTVTDHNNAFDQRPNQRGANPFTQPDGFQYAVQVYDCVLRGDKDTFACEYVARDFTSRGHKVSKPTVARAWAEYRKYFDIPNKITK